MNVKRECVFLILFKLEGQDVKVNVKRECVFLILFSIKRNMLLKQVFF